MYIYKVWQGKCRYTLHCSVYKYCTAVFTCTALQCLHILHCSALNVVDYPCHKECSVRHQSRSGYGFVVVSDSPPVRRLVQRRSIRHQSRSKRHQSRSKRHQNRSKRHQSRSKRHQSSSAHGEFRAFVGVPDSPLSDSLFTTFVLCLFSGNELLCRKDGR